jgi:hypothetical protein
MTKIKELQRKLAELKAQLDLDLACYAGCKEELKNDPGEAELKEACADWRELIAAGREEIKEVKAAIDLVRGKKPAGRQPSLKAEMEAAMGELLGAMKNMVNKAGTVEDKQKAREVVDGVRTRLEQTWAEIESMPVLH